MSRKRALRSRRITADLAFTVSPRKLSAKAKTELAGLLHADEGEWVREVEDALGTAIDGVQHLDHRPRARDYVAEFDRVRFDAHQLSERLAGWTGYFRAAALDHGCDVSELALELAGLVDASNAVIKANSGRQSRGAPRRTALTLSVQELRRTFAKHCRVASEERKRRGAFVWKTGRERRELEFVRIALRDANVVTKRFAEKEMARLLRDPRTQPSAPAPAMRRAP